MERPSASVFLPSISKDELHLIVSPLVFNHVCVFIVLTQLACNEQRIYQRRSSMSCSVTDVHVLVHGDCSTQHGPHTWDEPFILD